MSEELQDFLESFGLSLSLDKTTLWGTQTAEVQALADSWGIAFSDSADSLGCKWGLSLGAVPSHRREIARVEEAARRAMRIKHPVCSFLTKISAVSVGVLSLLDYVPLPFSGPILKLRSGIKKALGHFCSAPEALFNAFAETTIEPEGRWLLSLFHVFHCMRSHDGELTRRCLHMHSENSRLPALKKLLNRLDWSLDLHYLQCHTHIMLDQDWTMLSKSINRAYKESQYAVLAARRPRVFEGLTSIDARFMRKILRGLGNFQAAILVRVWTGAALTASHKHTLDKSCSPECTCGDPCQTYLTCSMYARWCLAQTRTCCYGVIAHPWNWESKLSPMHCCHLLLPLIGNAMLYITPRLSLMPTAYDAMFQDKSEMLDSLHHVRV